MSKVDLKEIMSYSNFALLGDTLNEEKTAYEIKKRLINAGYHVQCVGKELDSINDIQGEIDIIDLCIHPVKGIKLIKECKKKFKCILIQPGAADETLINYLNEQQLPYVEGCVLVGLSYYGRK